MRQQSTTQQCIFVSEKLHFSNSYSNPSSGPTDKSATRQRGISEVVSSYTADTGAVAWIGCQAICIVYIAGFVITTDVAS